MSNETIDRTASGARDRHGLGRKPADPGAVVDDGLAHRRVLAYLVAAPTLTVAARLAPDSLSSAPAGSTPGVGDLVDLGAAVALARPTIGLLVVEVTPQNRVVVRLPRVEVGPGITTAVEIIVADELDVRASDVDVVRGAARPELPYHRHMGGSDSVDALCEPLRVVAAAARSRLVTAAAEWWGVPAGALTTADTTVVGPGGLVASYGSLATAAAAIVVPAVSSRPKAPRPFDRSARHTGHIDVCGLGIGRARWAGDLDRPAAKPTVVARPPTIGGTAVAVDDTAARAVPGVIAVTPIPTGIAITAETLHQAQRGRDALVVTWTPSPTAPSDAAIRSQLEAAVVPFGVAPRGVITVARSFDFPFVPRASLEALSCVADVASTSAELWFSGRSPMLAGEGVAAAIGLRPEQVTVHEVRGGVSFGGRRSFDPAIEAALVAKAIGRPVKLMWTSDDDMRAGCVRPASLHTVRATHLLGRVLSYEHRTAALGAGHTLLQLTQQVPYDFGVETQLLSDVFLDAPTGGWPSIYAGQSATVNEVMVDEIARDLHQDAVAFRRQTLTSARAMSVLDKVAAAGRWGRTMAAGTAQGVAIHEEDGGVVAFLVEIDGRDPVRPRVTKGVCAVDGGGTGKPRGIDAELEGALIEAMWTTLPAGVRFDRGAVHDGRGDDLRCGHTHDRRPAMEVCVMAPTGPPGDAAELAYPAAAAAVANAYARATGTTPSQFPIAG